MFKRWFLRHWLLAVVASLLTGGYAYAADVAQKEDVPQLSGKILVVMTNHAKYPSRSDTTGLWFTELTHFYDVAQAAGLQMDFASPAGGEVPIDQRSLKSFYLDDSARAHLADPAFMARLKATLPAASVNPADYKAIYFTGGHGTLWDFPDNAALKAVSEQIYRQGGIVSAVCHGVSALLPLQDAEGKSLLAGVPVTGFSDMEETLSGMKSQVPLFLQDSLVSRGAHYKKALLPFTSYVVSDDRIITGQNPQSSKEIAEAVVKRLSEMN
ncbi:thiamine biosynthesis protein ThiJ [Burkholderia cepacia]|uniref:type 1 glutamine amidotransferase domain-containing protein n=1 Tax=Burkholderia cepacia TaxID=292 RepID=UPI00075545E2|nr:type 1 glutamine amidotransferase domain-containing protein [Burkholderia cepacia]KWH00477.1 thiamine biosynthesis protein ThiJ [Burkholderia cepacia]